MPKRKKSKYRHAVINKKKYYFYKVVWKDILGDSGHADSSEFDKMEPAVMVSQAYLYSKDNSNIQRIEKKIKNLYYIKNTNKPVRSKIHNFIEKFCK